MYVHKKTMLSADLQSKGTIGEMHPARIAYTAVGRKDMYFDREFGLQLPKAP